MKNFNPHWWKHAVLYEIYPRSFRDTKGDGIGDLNGITKQLDYLEDLGVDGIWITPFFPSPQVDFGYDISDYTAIDPEYGAMADFERLVTEADRRNIRIIVDLVLNHTSDRHPWFIESRSSRTNPKADWYMWHDGKPSRQPPNNWISIFGGSAWQWDDTRKQFYYHAFYKEQPDLNWHHPEVRKAMYDAARFWMEKGAAGFRLDAITTLFEDPKLRDEPYVANKKNDYGDRLTTRKHTHNLPKLHDVLVELRQVTDEYPGRVLIGETYVANIRQLAKMYGPHNDELQLPMNLQLGWVNTLSASKFRKKLRDGETGLRGNAPLYVMENHDASRSVSRYGDGKHNDEIAKLLATLLLTPRSVALMYYGEELGMPNHDPETKDAVLDPIGKRGWPKQKGRDGVRTPMQWDATRNAGFSTASATWLPVGPDYKTRNVEAQSKDPKSILNYYKALIRLRKTNPAWFGGSMTLIDESNPNVLSYLRQKDAITLLVTLNCTGKSRTVDLSKAVSGAKLKTLIASFDGETPKTTSKITLPAYGAYVGEVLYTD
jgi:alpha-glucosidase